MCFDTCKSLEGYGKTEPSGIYPFCSQEYIFAAIVSTDSGAVSAPESFPYTCSLPLIHQLPIIQSRGRNYVFFTTRQYHE